MYENKYKYFLLVKEEYGKKFYEIHESDEIFDYTLNKVLKTNYNEKWSHVDKSTMIKLCETLKVGVGDFFVYVGSKS